MKRIPLVETTRRALQLAIAATKSGDRLLNISHAVERAAKVSGCSVVRELVGHDVGHHLHEEPLVPNYGAF